MGTSRVALLGLAACGRVGFDEPVVDGAQLDSTVTKSFCTQREDLELCDDFDNGAFGAQWTTQITTGSATSMPVAGGLSAPNAARHRVQTFGGDGADIGVLQLNLVPMVTRLRYGADVRLDERPAIGRAEIQVVNLYVMNVGNFYMDVDFAASGDLYREELVPDDGSPFQAATQPIPAAEVGRWYRFELELDFAVQTYALRRDAIVISTGATRYPVAPGTVKLQSGIGWVYEDASGPWQFDIDNVTLDYE